MGLVHHHFRRRGHRLVPVWIVVGGLRGGACDGVGGAVRMAEAGQPEDAPHPCEFHGHDAPRRPLARRELEFHDLGRPERHRPDRLQDLDEMVPARAGGLHLRALRVDVRPLPLDPCPGLEPFLRLDAGFGDRHAGPAGVLPGPEMADRGRP